MRRAVKSKRRTWFINYLPTRKAVRCAKGLNSNKKKKKNVRGESRKSSDLSEKVRAKVGQPGSKSRESTPRTRDTYIYKEDARYVLPSRKVFFRLYLQDKFTTNTFSRIFWIS